MTATAKLDELIAASGLVADGRGTPLSDPSYVVELDRCLATLAGALDRLAGMPAVADAGDTDIWHDPAGIVRAAQEAVDGGVVSTESLSPAYRHMDPQRLVDVLADGIERTRTRSDAPVLSNGLVTFDNTRADGGELVGLQDWARAATADRHRDLAVCAKSLLNSAGPAVMPALFSKLSLDADPVLLDWYLLAVELVR